MGRRKLAKNRRAANPAARLEIPGQRQRPGPTPARRAPAGAGDSRAWTRIERPSRMLTRGPASNRASPGWAPPHMPKPALKSRHSGRVSVAEPSTKAGMVAHPDDPGLEVGVEVESGDDRAVVDPALGEQSEGRRALVAAERLAALGGDGDGDAGKRLPAHAGGEFGAALDAADRRARAQAERRGCG